MILGLITLLVAIIISAVAAYYSILGLVSIFAAAALPVIIMGASLEAGKLMAAVWLHKNWQRAGYQFKLYLVPAIVFLMLLTSMGVFGFLSKAHLDQGVPTGNVAAQIELIDTKIETQREHINASKKTLQQLDASVDAVLGRSKNEQGAARSAALRKSQTKDRVDAQVQIETAQTQIATLNEEKSRVKQELRRAEAEVGPIKYVAALIYGADTNESTLENAVRWVIILIVGVFDPLAVVLILAGSKQLEWAKQERIARRRVKETPAPAYPPDDGPLTDNQVAQVKEHVITGLQVVPDSFVPVPVDEPAMVPAEDTIIPVEKKTPKRQKPSIVVETPVEPVKPIMVAPKESVPYRPSIPEAAPGVNRRVMHSHLVQADNVPTTENASSSGFGSEFPAAPKKGALYLRVDILPNRLYKYNGDDWILVDKNQTDVYAYDILYIQHLITEIAAGRYDAESLTDVESDQVAQYLKKNS